MRNWLGLATLAAAAALWGCGPRATDNSSVAVLHEDNFTRAGLQFYWKSQLPLNPGETLVQSWLIDDAVYYLSSQRRLFCYDPQVGTPRWIFTIHDRGSAIFAPCHGPDISITRHPQGIQGVNAPILLTAETYKPLAINTARTVYLLDRTTGTQLRRIDAQGIAMTTGGSMDARHFFVGLLDGSYIAFDLQEGIRSNWKGTVQAAIKATPQYMDRHVYVAGINGQLHCRIVDDNGRLEWGPVNLVKGVFATPLVDRRFCLVPVEDGRLYALHPLTGVSIWPAPFTAKRGLVNSPQASTNTVYQYARGDRFYALDPDRGSERWDNPTAMCVLGVIQNMVYAFSTHNDLLALTEITGEVRHQIPLDGFTIYAPNTSQNYAAIFIASPDGQAICIRPVSAGRINVNMLPAR